MKYLKKNILFIGIFLSVSTQSISQNIVPDSSTAIKIAEAIWLPIYGKEIYKELPFNAKLRGDTVWVVTSTSPKFNREELERAKAKGDTYVFYGGFLIAEIQKKDAKVLLVTHFK